MRRRRSGLTLVELLVALLLTVTITAALAVALGGAMDVERRHKARQAEHDTEAAVQARVSELLAGAQLADDETDTNTYFVGDNANGGDASDLGCDRLTFTTGAPGVPQAAMRSDDDFETQQTARGPVGGLAEASLATTPVGDEGQDKAGLFERVQRPADGDPTQGGEESLLWPGVARVGFQFWDGAQWATAWDTRTGDHRLPAAVKVSYVPEGAADDAVRAFVVPVPASDVDAQDPANQATSTAPGGAAR